MAGGVVMESGKLGRSLAASIKATAMPDCI
jgi:hypothetical protein